jgi:predicted GH43/DUF377 family glycosyl hydrolase
LAQGPGDDNLDLYAAAVIKDGSIWKMWYTGHNSAGEYELMYATASNPGGPWTRYSNYYIWENSDNYISPNEVWKEGSTYFMTYFDDLRNIEVATSANGITGWTRRGSAMSVGSAGSWDDVYVWFSSQVLINGTWYNYYTGLHEHGQIGLATSAIRTPWSSDGTFAVADMAVASQIDNFSLSGGSIRRIDGSLGGLIKKIDGSSGGIPKRFVGAGWQ